MNKIIFVLVALCATGLHNSSFAAKIVEDQNENQGDVVDDESHIIEPLEEANQESWLENNVEVSGEIEIYTFRHTPYIGSDVDDFVLSEVELEIEVEVNDYVSGELAFLYEDEELASEEGEEDEEGAELEVDIAQIEIRSLDDVWSVNVGRFYLPFGYYENEVVFDSLLEELGQINKTSVLIEYAPESYFVQAYTYNGENEGKEFSVDDFGVTVGLLQESDETKIFASIGYISNIGGSEELAEVVDESEVSGFSAYLSAELNVFTFSAEYIAALDDFQMEELAFNGTGATPVVWGVDAKAETSISAYDVIWSVGYQKTEEALGLGFPEQRFHASVSVDILENMSIALEWLNDDDYSAANGGTGNTSNTIAGQLAVSF